MCLVDQYLFNALYKSKFVCPMIPQPDESGELIPICLGDPEEVDQLRVAMEQRRALEPKVGCGCQFDLTFCLGFILFLV